MASSLPKRVLQIGSFVIIAGIALFLIFYAVKYVPAAISRLSGAVYLSGDTAKTPTPKKTPSVISTTTVATTTNATDETEYSQESPATPPKASNPVTVASNTNYVPRTGGPLYSAPRYYYYPQTPRLYGLADLTVSITAVGYVKGTNASTFREADEVPEGRNPAMKFTVSNKGTNASGLWRLMVTLPSEDKDEYTFNSQESLLPGATKNYTVFFDEAQSGNNQVLRVEVDYRDDVDESNEKNNKDSASIDIED